MSGLKRFSILFFFFLCLLLIAIAICMTDYGHLWIW